MIQLLDYCSEIHVEEGGGDIYFHENNSMCCHGNSYSTKNEAIIIGPPRTPRTFISHMVLYL